MSAETPAPGASRRQFLQQSSVAVGGLLAAPSLLRPRRPGKLDELRVGLIGCGGRGSGAALQALRADKGVRLVALADAVSDRLQSSLGNLKSSNAGDRVHVDPAHQFVGFDAGRRLIESDIDVVLLAEPPHFRPRHLELAIERGLHVFAEKPVAVDGPGVRSVLASARRAQEKNLSLVSGLCWRYDHQKRDTIQEVLNGRIGDITAMQCTYNTGALWHRGQNPQWTEMEYQVRNWLYYTWLSGDHIAEQHIHSLDKMPWAMGGVYPTRCVASGGRQVRTDPMYGNVYDHFNCTFEWENGVRGFASCRQWAGAASDVSDHIFGTKGRCHVFDHLCTDLAGNVTWEWEGKPNDMYQAEHDVLFQAIRRNEPVNNGDYMAKSTLMAIMGRMSAYTGKAVTFDEALASEERLGPAGDSTAYSFGPMPTEPIARPGL